MLDDAERDAIIKAVLSVASFRISAYNVLEAAKTADEVRRTALIDLMRCLVQGKRPLDRPNTILLAYATAHARHAASVEVNRDDNLEGIWVALNEPDLIDEDARKEVLEWAQDLERDFDKVTASDRKAFQDLFTRDPSAQPQSIASTIRQFLAKRNECKSLVTEIYKRQVGKTLPDAGYQELLREPVWPLYLLGYAYGVHKRSIERQGFSPKRNAGALDLNQAVYLTMCDRFVTNDKDQYRALRLLNTFNTKRHTEVLRYDTFRSRLLAFG